MIATFVTYLLKIEAKIVCSESARCVVWKNCSEKFNKTHMKIPAIETLFHDSLLRLANLLTCWLPPLHLFSGEFWGFFRKIIL